MSARARFASVVVEELEGRRPDLVFRLGDDDALLVDKPGTPLSVRVTLRPLLVELAAHPDKAEPLIERYAQALLEKLAAAERPPPIADADLITLLKTSAQIDGIRAFLRVHDPGNDLICAPFVGELQMMLAAYRPSGEAEPLTRREAQQLGRDEPGLARVALENLRQRFLRVEREPVDDMPGLYVTKGPLAASMILFSPLFQEHALRCRGELLAVAAARDFVLSADSYLTGVLYDLPVLASRVRELSPDPLSDEVLKWTPAGFELF